MPPDLSQLEDRLRAAYADAAATVQSDDISERAPAATSPVRWRAAARTGSSRAAALAAAAAVLLIVITATVIPHVLRSGGPGAAAHVPHSHMAYVVGQRDLLIPVNLATGGTLKPIPLGVAGGETGEAISPDGKLVYVLTARGQLVPVDVRTGRAGPPIDVGGVPQDLLTTPNGKAAYVLEPPYGVVAVDLATRTALGFIKVHDAQSFALTPNGRTLYVLGPTTNTTDLILTAIDTATNTTAGTLALTGPHLQPRLRSQPYGPCRTLPSATGHGSQRICHLRCWHVQRSEGESVTMAPDGKTVYVSYRSFKASARPGESASIIPVDTASNTGLKPINVSGSGIQDFTISADSQTGYVSGAHSVTPIDLRTRAVLPSIQLPGPSQSGYGYDLTLSPDGLRLYMIQNVGPAVIPVDTAPGTAMQPIQLGAPRWNARDGVFAPGGKTLYVLSDYGYPKGALIAGRMTPVDAATGAVGKPIDFPAGLSDIVFSP